MITNAPILTEPEQPEDFEEIIGGVEASMRLRGLNWHSDRVVQFVQKLHELAGYTPANYEIARYALSYRQLKTLKSKLDSM